MDKVGVFYGSTTGDTEEVALSLVSELKDYELMFIMLILLLKRSLQVMII